MRAACRGSCDQGRCACVDPAACSGDDGLAILSSALLALTLVSLGYALALLLASSP